MVDGIMGGGWRHLFGQKTKHLFVTIRAKLGLTPQMDVGPYADGWGGVWTGNKRNIWCKGPFKCYATPWGWGVSFPEKRVTKA